MPNTPKSAQAESPARWRTPSKRCRKLVVDDEEDEEETLAQPSPKGSTAEKADSPRPKPKATKQTTLFGTTPTKSPKTATKQTTLFGASPPKKVEVEAKAKRPARKAARTSAKTYVDDDDDGDDDDDDKDEPEKQGKRGGRLRNGDDLPVIREPQAMFDHLVGQAPGLLDFAKRLSRPLRVATMCSGTESPVLALQMIQRALDVNHKVSLGLDHVFSCEIEPFKQAYIERNFAPPILFRDIRELGQQEATTAYGAKVPVPGDCDMLVAGTSCVDYSNLNNEKKDLEASGESGQTFRGMMKWVEKFQPPIVILENVCGAPWDKVKKAFEDKGYEADYQRVDTKFHYIPHTRTRVYLFATLAKGKGVTSKWLAMVKSLERPSSSVLEAFLLPSDDPRVHNARRALAAPAAERGRTRTDWSRCESRHQRARLEENLGQKRPLTGWEEGGRCSLPDYAWKDWGKASHPPLLHP